MDTTSNENRKVRTLLLAGKLAQAGDWDRAARLWDYALESDRPPRVDDEFDLLQRWHLIVAAVLLFGVFVLLMVLKATGKLQ